MAESLIPSWLPSALTGGLAGSLITLLVGWLKGKTEAKRIRAQQIKALKEELRHTKWLVEYNHGRIRSPDLPHKGLTNLGASNVEQILFSSATRISLPSNVVEHLHDYLQQVVYHNNLVEEYKVLLLEPPQASKSVWVNRSNTCMGEIEAICTPEATYRNKDELSLRARIDRLLNELDKAKKVIYAAAQHSVQLTVGTHRVFWTFFWLWLFPVSTASLPSHPPQLTHTVSP